MHIEDIRPLKPHIRADNEVLVKYRFKKDDVQEAIQVFLNVVNYLESTGHHINSFYHLPSRSCTGCHDPECTYDAQNGFIGARFI